MSARHADASVPDPRETSALFGHQAAEAALLEGHRSGRMAHAWLLGGPRGIGKATLAYRMARFVLAHGTPSGKQVQDATTLAVDPAHPAARQVAAGTHGGLLTLQRAANDKGILYTVIRVDDARKTIGFFGSTAAADGWRVCIVDPVDELNANAANALLKVLEEPPPRSLFLLVSHAPAGVIPTIRSRCRKLSLRQLSQADVLAAVAQACGRDLEDPALFAAAAASEGSVARAVTLLGSETAGVQQRTGALLRALPKVDPMALHALGDALGLSDRAALAAFVDGINAWIADALRADTPDLGRLARLTSVWEKIVSAARDTEIYNLDRKPLVFSAFGQLADAVR